MSYQALLFCPDEKTARVVTQVLTDLDFMVEPCNEPFAAVKKLMGQHFDAVVVDSDNEQNATLLFKSARNSATNHSSLAVAVVEGQVGVAKAFRIGANLVLTKPINVEQSKGTLRVARGLLRKGSDATNISPVSAPSAVITSSSSVSGRSTDVSANAKQSALGSAAAKPQSAMQVSAPTSQFEVEKEPEPQPEPAEAAFLESIPDAMAGATSKVAPTTEETSETAKDFPWQPVTNPQSEPMASAMRRAAEAAGKKIESESASTGRPTSPSLTPSKGSDTWPAAKNAGWNSGAASAPAPAKERSVVEPRLETLAAAPASIAAARDVFAKPSTTDALPAIEAPSFSTLDDAQELAGARSGKKTLTIAVAVLLLLAACGYFAWTKMRLGSAPAPLAQTATAPPAPAVPASATQPGKNDLPVPASTTAPAASSTGNVPTELTPNPRTSGPATKEEPASASNAKPTPAIKVPEPEPVVVKPEAPKPAPAKPAVEESIAPPAPGVVAGEEPGGSQVLSGIVTSTPTSVPKPAPQTVKVSQGVSQGLLIKRVQPVYPTQALQMRVQGAVQLQAAITKDGAISSVKVLSGDAVLARAAVDAVRQWKYKPYYLNGEPVEIQTQITVIFRLP